MKSKKIQRKKIWLIIMLLLAACSPAAKSEPNTPSVTAFPTQINPGANLAPTQKAATITPLPTRITPTVYPPFTPPPDWLTYVHPDLAISIQYPPNWQVISPDELGGADGSVSFGSREYEGVGLNAVCQLEVNRYDLYGKQPLVTLWNNANGFYGCEILPSSDATDSQNGLILAWYSTAIPSNSILEITGFTDYLKAVENSIKATTRLPKTVMYMDGLPPQCILNSEPPLVTRTSGLQFEAYRLTNDDCYQRMDVEAFAALLPPQASARINQLRIQSDGLFEEINLKLAPFNYTIRGHVLYQGQNPVSGQLEWVGQPAVNASQTLLYLPVNEALNYKTYKITRDSFTSIQNTSFYSSIGYVPTRVFLGDDLIRLDYDPLYHADVGYPYGLQVLKNSELIFEYTVLPPSPASGPVRGLYAWQGHWILEVADVFIRDGVVLNNELGYSELFTWRLINDQPFYFFRQGDRVYLSYNDATLPQTYERLLHEPSCCSGAMVNMTLADDALGFYALRDGYWYYVIVAVEE